MSSLPNKDQLVKTITRIMNADGTEDELDEMLSELEEVTPLSVSDLIFYPDTEMSAEEIAEKILSYKPTLLS